LTLLVPFFFFAQQGSRYVTEWLFEYPHHFEKFNGANMFFRQPTNLGFLYEIHAPCVAVFVVIRPRFSCYSQACIHQLSWIADGLAG
jgi:hypothetical protein